MKHIIKSGSGQWKFEETPFPAFRCYLGGRCRVLVPVKDVQPITTYRVIGYSYDEKSGALKESFIQNLYEGTDEQKANYVLHRASNIAIKFGVTPAELHVVKSVLPDHKFRVIRTKKGTMLVVPGEDRSDRALAFVGCESGYRGGVGVEEATCNVLLTARVGFRLWAGVEVVAIFEPGQRITFHRTGRREDEYVRYTWDGSALKKDVYTPELWEASRLAEAAESGVGDVGEVL
jgi:hypothetical protein